MFEFIVKKVENKVRTDGWESLPLAVARSLYYRIKYLPQTLYLKGILQNKRLARIFPFKKPVKLIISTPRSGSSWVGKVLSLSPDIAYLREPVTQALIQKSKLNSTRFDPGESENKFEIYKKYSDQAFRGMPPVFKAIENVSDYFLLNRSAKSLLIKEVNPLAIKFFLEYYAPKVIILLRHPAGVVDSRKRMGWLKKGYEEAGYRYGSEMAAVLKTCENTTFKVQVYEEIAKNPMVKFAGLIEFIGARLPENYEAIIDEYCNERNNNWDPYNTKRTSENEAYKWRRNLDSRAIESVKKGYLKSELPYYRNHADWRY